MLGFESENRLKNFLAAVGSGEQNLEGARQRLCRISDFAPHSAFQRFDRNGNGFVCAREIQDFLRDQRCYGIGEHELYRLVNFFDSDSCGRLSFQDFLQVLLPCTDNFLRNLTLDRPARYVGRFDSLPFDIERAIVDVIQQEVDLQRRLDTLKGCLEFRYDYTPLAAFRSVDRYNDGRIDSYNLRNFLQSQGHYATETELLAIIRRIDTDGDARVNYSELAEFLRAAQPSSGGSFSPSRSEPPARATSAGPARASSPLRPTSPPPRQESPAELRYSSPPRRGPMLGLREEDELVHNLKELIRIENEIEGDKVRLATKPDFNLTDAFKIFDQRGMGVVDSFDLRSGLNAIGLYPTQDELDLWVARYDTTGDRRINSREFDTAFLALDGYYSSMVARRPSNYKYPLYRRDDCFGYYTAEEFRTVWRTHFRAEAQAESVRQRLRNMPYFNIYDAFNSLDLNGTGQISREEFKRMIQSRGLYVSEKEVNELVEKMDKNKDGRVSFAEFADEIRPRSPVRH